MDIPLPMEVSFAGKLIEQRMVDSPKHVLHYFTLIYFQYFQRVSENCHNSWWILVDFVIFWVKHLRLFWYVGYWYAVAFTGEIQPVSNGPPVLVHEKKYPYPGKTPDLVPESERKNAGHFHQK